MGLGWGIAYQIFFQNTDLNRSKALILFWGLFASAWLGAKLLFLITSAPTNFEVMSSNFWLGGGFVFYGGVLASAVFILLLKYFQFNFNVQTINSLILALVFGHAIGRVGCFLAGCCFGAPTDWFWGIHLHGTDRHPTQLLETLGLLVMGFTFLKIKSSVNLLGYYALFYGLLRFGLENIRGDGVRGEWFFWTPGEWISVFLVIYGLFLLIKKSKHPTALN